MDLVQFKIFLMKYNWSWLPEKYLRGPVTFLPWRWWHVLGGSARLEHLFMSTSLAAYLLLSSDTVSEELFWPNLLLSTK